MLTRAIINPRNKNKSKRDTTGEEGTGGGTLTKIAHEHVPKSHVITRVHVECCKGIEKTDCRK